MKDAPELPLSYCIRLLRLEGPTHAAQAGWSLNLDKIDKALDFLHIETYVRIRFTAGYATAGSHSDLFQFHLISMSQLWDIDFANEVLWHELIHAKQSEDYQRESGMPLSEFSRVYHELEAQIRSYKNNPFEIEANALAAKYSKVMLLQD